MNKKKVKQVKRGKPKQAPNKSIDDAYRKLATMQPTEEGHVVVAEEPDHVVIAVKKTTWQKICDFMGW
jgi:hypothetical protein